MVNWCHFMERIFLLLYVQGSALHKSDHWMAQVSKERNSVLRRDFYDPHCIINLQVIHIYFITVSNL